MSRYGSNPQSSRRASFFYLYMFALSIISLSLFAAAVPDILRYRKSHKNWTGRWVEIVAIIILALCSSANLLVFFVLLFQGSSSMGLNTTVGIHSILLGLLIWILVLTVSAGGSSWWKPTPDSGEFRDMSLASRTTYMHCNTIARSGVDCSIGTLRRISILQIMGITFLCFTLALDIFLLVRTYRAHSEILLDKWSKRLGRMSRDASSSTADNNGPIHFQNDIPGCSEERDGLRVTDGTHTKK